MKSKVITIACHCEPAGAAICVERDCFVPRNDGTGAMTKLLPFTLRLYGEALLDKFEE